MSFGTSRDIAGIVLWVIGWVIESIADIQKVSLIQETAVACSQLFLSSGSSRQNHLEISPQL